MILVANPDGNGFPVPRQHDGGRMISVVVPIYCEQQILPEFHTRAKAALASLAPKYAHELIFVNDGSTDASLQILHAIAKADPSVRVLSLARNFGHQLAITAGLDHAQGDAAVVIDADLQDPPELIPDMVRKWEEGFKVVYGVRQTRQGETAFKLATAKLFYRLLSYLSDTPLPLDSGDFRLLDRAVIDALCQIREESRYIRGLVSWIGFTQCPIPYQRAVRRAGETKFPLRKMLRFALDGISSFSEKPLRLSSHLGFLVTVLSLLAAVFIIVRKFVYHDQLIPGWASVMVTVLFMGGIQLLSIGILGEYVGRIFRQSKGRPLYIVAEKINLEPQAASAPKSAEAANSTEAPKSPEVQEVAR